MKAKRKNYRNGSVVMTKSFPSGLYLVECWAGNDMVDKVRCDDYRIACEYFKAFSAIAKAA